MQLSNEQLFKDDFKNLLLNTFYLDYNTGSFVYTNITAFEETYYRYKTKEHTLAIVNNSKNIIIPFMYFNGAFSEVLLDVLTTNKDIFIMSFQKPSMHYQTSTRMYDKFIGRLYASSYFDNNIIVRVGTVFDATFKRLLIFSVLDVTNKKVIIYVSKHLFSETYKKLLPLYKKIEKNLFSNKYVEYIICNDIMDYFGNKGGVNVVPCTAIAPVNEQFSEDIFPLIYETLNDTIVDTDNIYKYILNEKVSHIKPSKLHLILQNNDEKLLSCQSQESMETL